ncbi:hypothetical protein ABZ135_10620 [Streptomyces sp. NPDC006339]|uniref:hypothetical protein n=1 Tax=Streptomyces sp. NPDC006339 TaxID=3156755 RepID=UPI0033B5B41A
MNAMKSLIVVGSSAALSLMALVAAGAEFTQDEFTRGEFPVASSVAAAPLPTDGGTPAPGTDDWGWS